MRRVVQRTKTNDELSVGRAVQRTKTNDDLSVRRAVQRRKTNVELFVGREVQRTKTNDCLSRYIRTYIIEEKYRQIDKINFHLSVSIDLSSTSKKHSLLLVTDRHQCDHLIITGFPHSGLPHELHVLSRKLCCPSGALGLG